MMLFISDFVINGPMEFEFEYVVVSNLVFRV